MRQERAGFFFEKKKQKTFIQPWIDSAGYDGTFILGPALFVTAAVLVFRPFFVTHPVSPILWALLIVGVDVAHVYSTLYSTYFDRAEFHRRRTLYTAAPVLGWAVFACLYSLGPMLFWRVLAYLAAFHFVRQQYGFMMIYSRRDQNHHRIDGAAIYGATAFPLIWWHTHPRHFAWFIDGDFFQIACPWLGNIAALLYAAILLAYAVKETAMTRRHGFNWPRNLLLAGTALSWGVGIVALDSDLAFTALNVLAHGIPYMALIWRQGRVRGRLPVFAPTWLPLFVALPVLLAYCEEGIWDRLVWSDHPELFALFDSLQPIEDPALLALIVPLLALPQITHYVLDAFIWRRSSADPSLRAMLA